MSALNPIIKSLLGDFKERFEIENETDPIVFEQFVCYSIASSFTRDQIKELDSIWLSNDKSEGIDGLAIYVNNRLVSTLDEIAELLEMNGYLEAAFVFIQAKTSPVIKTSDVKLFCSCVRSFLQHLEDKPIKEGEQLRERKELIKSIFGKSAKFRESPKIFLYYVSLGREDEVDLSFLRLEEQELKALGLASTTSIKVIDTEGIRRLYSETLRAVERTIDFKLKLTLPENELVQEAYLGVLPFREFIKLITNEEGDLEDMIFEDNVRAYQGSDNPVNEKISQTLQEGRFSSFAFLNNGVTLVARSITPSGNKFTLRDYQIVNGCQTSNVLFQNRDLSNIADEVYVPIKIIATKKEEFVNRIIQATNQQSLVRTEEIESLSEFHRLLEAFYLSYSPGPTGKLWYERRNKQYANAVEVKRNRIVAVEQQAKAWIAVGHNLPHEVFGRYETFRARVNTKIGDLFKDSKQLWQYFTSAWLLVEIERLFRTSHLQTKYRKARYFLAMITKFKLMENQDFPDPTDSKKVEKYCKDLLKSASTEERLLNSLLDGCEVIERASKKNWDRDTLKTKKFTDSVREEIGCLIS